MRLIIWSIVVIFILVLVVGYYVYFHPTVLSGLSGISQIAQLTVNIPNLQINTTSYLNNTFSVRGNLESRLAYDTYTQAGIQHSIGQYFSNNQTQWYFPLSLPNQPNRQWQEGDSYLFTGHLSKLYGCHTIIGRAVGGGQIEAGSWSLSQNSSCWDNITIDQHSASPPENSSEYHCIYTTNSTFLGGGEYTCYPLYSAQILYYFNSTNATLNG